MRLHRCRLLINYIRSINSPPTPNSAIPKHVVTIILLDLFFKCLAFTAAFLNDKNDHFMLRVTLWIQCYTAFLNLLKKILLCLSSGGLITLLRSKAKAWKFQSLKWSSPKKDIIAAITTEASIPQETFLWIAFCFSSSSGSWFISAIDRFDFRFPGRQFLAAMYSYP